MGILHQEAVDHGFQAMSPELFQANQRHLSHLSPPHIVPDALHRDFLPLAAENTHGMAEELLQLAQRNA